MYLVHMVSATHCFLKDVSLKMTPAVGIVSKICIPNMQERGQGASDCPDPVLMSNGHHVLLVNSSDILDLKPLLSLLIYLYLKFNSIGAIRGEGGYKRTPEVTFQCTIILKIAIIFKDCTDS